MGNIEIFLALTVIPRLSSGFLVTSFRSVLLPRYRSPSLGNEFSLAFPPESFLTPTEVTHLTRSAVFRKTSDLHTNTPNFRYPLRPSRGGFDTSQEMMEEPAFQQGPGEVMKATSLWLEPTPDGSLR